MTKMLSVYYHSNMFTDNPKMKLVCKFEAPEVKKRECKQGEKDGGGGGG